MSQVYENILEMVGNTPMVNLKELAGKYKCNATILAKCDFYNPLFSAKDRIALKMLEKAEAEHKLSAKSVVIEATSGNTGVALASLCAFKGYNLIIVAPTDTSKEKVKLIKTFGAKVILTDAQKGMAGSIEKVKELCEQDSSLVWLNQFENPANVQAHQFGTGVEILEQTDGNIDAIVVGVGTSGSLTGIAKTLKEFNPKIYVVGVEPAASAVLNGKPAGAHKIEGIGAGFVPPLYEDMLVNEIIDVSDEEAITTCKETAKTEGLPVCVSSGAVLFAALSLGQRPEFKNKNIVVLLPGSIERDLDLL